MHVVFMPGKRKKKGKGSRSQSSIGPIPRRKICGAEHNEVIFMFTF